MLIDTAVVQSHNLCGFPDTGSRGPRDLKDGWQENSMWLDMKEEKTGITVPATAAPLLLALSTDTDKVGRLEKLRKQFS